MKIPNSIVAALRLVGGYALAVAAGYAAHLVHLPLAWVLGPLLLAAGLAMAGLKPSAPVNLRRIGQLIIGATVGLSLTSGVVAGLLPWLPVMVLTGLAAVFVSATLSVAFAMVAKLDTKTAFFAMLPGGLAEMGNIGAGVGARMEPIALSQTIRVAIVVLLIPPLLVVQGITTPSVLAQELPAASVLLLLGAGLAGAFATRLARINNPWMIGALLSSGALAATGVLEGRMPGWIFAVGQILIGYNIGARFRRDIVRALPRVALATVFAVLALIAIMAAYAAAMVALSGLDFATGFLAASPGGTAEMAATAQALHLPVALITAFHMTRSILVNGFATHYWRALSRTGYLTMLERWFRRLT